MKIAWNCVAILGFVSLCSFSSFSQENPYENKNRLRLDPKKPLRIEFTFKPWNKNPQLEETAWIIIKDFKSGRLVKIQLQETSSDSGQFIGNYSLTWKGGEEFVPEVYLAPQELLKSTDELKKVDLLINEGLLLRKPYFMKTVNGIQVITVFENSEQALRAFQEYRKNLQGKSVVDPAALEAQKKAQLYGEAAKLAATVTAQELLRKDMVDREQQLQNQAMKVFESLSEKDKNKRREEAKALSNEANSLEKNNQLAEAAHLLQKAIQLDPTNPLLRYQYGLLLFKMDKNNESLIQLRLVKGQGINPHERDYYIALNFVKLKEEEAAMNMFKSISEANDKPYSALASFYMGVIEYSHEKWDLSQKHFEHTIDISGDPKLDSQAETYIEQIAQMKQFEAEKSKKIIVGLNFGVNYDSNILLTPNLSTEAATVSDVAGWRAVLLGTLEYRPVYSDRHEFSVTSMYYDMYSYDQSLRPSSTLQKADPLVFSVTAPYKYKGQIGKTGFQLGLTPGYDSIRLDLEATGTRSEILTSQYLKTDTTLVMTDDWFSNYYFEIRQDSSKLSVAAEEDSSAMKYTLGATQTVFQDKKKTEAWIGESILTHNKANGDNQKYNKIDLAGTYMSPAFWNTSWNTRLGFSYTNYDQHASKRADTNMALSTGWRKPLTTELTLTFNLSYTLNSSNVEASRYDKYGAGALLTWNKAF